MTHYVTINTTLDPYESVVDAMRQQAIHDVHKRWSGGKVRRRVLCDPKNPATTHPAARCALDYLKHLRAVRIAASVYGWTPRQTIEALFMVGRP